MGNGIGKMVNLRLGEGANWCLAGLSSGLRGRSRFHRSAARQFGGVREVWLDDFGAI